MQVGLPPRIAVIFLIITFFLRNYNTLEMGILPQMGGFMLVSVTVLALVIGISVAINSC
jgi:hypothetical protein